MPSWKTATRNFCIPASPPSLGHVVVVVVVVRAVSIAVVDPARRAAPVSNYELKIANIPGRFIRCTRSRQLVAPYIFAGDNGSF